MARDEHDKVTIDLQHSQRMQAIAQEYGDNNPYNTTRAINECKFYLGQAGEAMLEAGKRLILLKEFEVHGDFQNALEEIGLGNRIAQKMMQATVKFSNPKLTSNAKTFSHLGTSKLYELMLLDDEELEGLAEGGTVADVNLDEIDRMSVRELKARIREMRDTKDADNSILERKTKELINLQDKNADLSRKLHTKEKLTEKPDPDAEGRALLNELNAIASEVQVAVLMKQLPAAFDLLKAHQERTGVDHSQDMQAAITKIEQQCLVLREDYNLHRPAGGTALDWMSDEAETETAERVKAMMAQNPHIAGDES